MNIFSTILFALTISTNLFAQIDDITSLPVQNPAHSLKESAPVWISENEIIIFFANETLDTIYSTRSNDRGISWEDPIVIRILDHLDPFLHLCAFRSSTGRIMAAWSVLFDKVMELIYSDDNGESWSQAISIQGGGFINRSAFPDLLQFDSGTIALSFNSIWPSGYLRYSYDDGSSWVDSDIISFPYSSENLTVESIGSDSLLAVFRNGFSIYSSFSFDNGLTWSDTVKIADDIYDSVRLEKHEDGSLLVIYDALLETEYDDYTQTEVVVLKSYDKGQNWDEGIKFTSYVGDDLLNNVSSLANSSIITFSSQRSSNDQQIYYGIFGESADVLTPPVVISTRDSIIENSNEDDEIIINSTIIDDNNVAGAKFSINDVLNMRLYDDGLHEDEEADDNIWGNRSRVPHLTSVPVPNYYINVNKIELPFNNAGVLADSYASSKVEYIINSEDINENKAASSGSLQIMVQPTGKYDEGRFLFSGGFWLSGYSNGELWANGVASAELIEDYLPGKVGIPTESLSNPKIYVVNKHDIPFGYTWDYWKEAVELGAGFYDGDGDGIYNPVDKNWNGTWDTNEDMPPVIGEEIAWCVYNDGLPSNNRRWDSVEPQGIEIQQTVFATSLPELENVIFIKYSILNIGSVADEMDSVYFGIWEDGDLGDHTDDVVGCDTLLNSGFVYNITPDNVYGENCPSFFTSLLQGPIIKTNSLEDTAHINSGGLIGSELITEAKNLDISSHVFFVGGDPNLMGPRNKYEAMNFLLGRNNPGDIINPCQFPYCEVRGGISCSEVNPHLWASGDPVTDVGWISRIDWIDRNLISTGPFQLEKEKPQEIIIAYVIGRGTDYFNSITVARENVSRAIAEYESNFASMTYSSPPPANPVTDYVLYHNYPNPFNPTTTIRYEIPQDGLVTIDVYDILGQKVRTILNEFQKADRYEVDFNAVGFASGVYIYRMKVNEFITSKKMLLIK